MRAGVRAVSYTHLAVPPELPEVSGRSRAPISAALVTLGFAAHLLAAECRVQFAAPGCSFAHWPARGSQLLDVYKRQPIEGAGVPLPDAAFRLKNSRLEQLGKDFLKMCIRDRALGGSRREAKTAST